MTHYDFVIIGGGPAGSTAATQLAKFGFKVLILEKEIFPRFHIGESLLPFCYSIFEELGVLEEMIKKFPRKPGVVFSNSDASSQSHWCFNRVIDDPSYLSFHVSRAEFDHILLKNSLSHGADIIEGAKVLTVDFDSLQDGVKIEFVKGSKKQVKTAGFLVDASGQRTFLANALGMKEKIPNMKNRTAYSTHWENTTQDEALINGNIKIIHLGGEHQGWIWMIPINGNRLSVGLVVASEYSKAKLKSLQADDKLKEFYMRELFAAEGVKPVLQGAKTVRDIEVNADYSYRIREKFGAKYATAGDAAAFLDPVFSSGVYLGMKSSLLIAEALKEKFQNGHDRLQQVYTDIEGAYEVVSELIKTFYDPDSIKFDEVNNKNISEYEKFEAAYSILHLVLAGDFFTNYRKYIDAIGMLKDQKVMAKYRHLINHSNSHEACREITTS